MDVKTTFLHDSIKEEVYVEQPEGFEIHNQKSHVCRLKKALYALKQAPRAWYERIDSYLMKLGFTKSEVDPNLYFKVEDDKPLTLVLYVDDLFLTDANPLIHKCKRELDSEFEMNDLGLMHYFLGLEVWQKLGEIFLSQGKYVVKILERFGNVVDRKSTFGCYFSLGSTSISWISRKQKSVALSTTEAEYIAASMASCEAVWLKKLFSELFGYTLDTTVILCNNQSGIQLSENLVFHDCSKHIDIKYHFIRDMVQRGAIRLHHLRTDLQVADILTKPLGKVKFLTFRERLGFMERPSYEGLV
eukprot:PITA_36255